MPRAAGGACGGEGRGPGRRTPPPPPSPYRTGRASRRTRLRGEVRERAGARGSAAAGPWAVPQRWVWGAGQRRSLRGGGVCVCGGGGCCR